jgi:hypothetical protein
MTIVVFSQLQRLSSYAALNSSRVGNILSWYKQLTQDTTSCDVNSPSLFFHAGRAKSIFFRFGANFIGIAAKVAIEYF